MEPQTNRPLLLPFLSGTNREGPGARQSPWSTAGDTGPRTWQGTKGSALLSCGLHPGSQVTDTFSQIACPPLIGCFNIAQ